MQSEPSTGRAEGIFWRSDRPFPPSAFPFYYGWIILIVSTVGLVASAPGQTLGVSVFTESLLEVTGLSRVQLSNAYLMGTLGSGLLLPYAGTVLDRIGVRRGVVWSSMGLGLVLALLSQVDHMTSAVEAWGVDREIASYAILTFGFLGLRFTGQGALTLSCRTMLARWFERRRGLASSISAPFASVAFASSPVLLAGWV